MDLVKRLALHIYLGIGSIPSFSARITIYFDRLYLTGFLRVWILLHTPTLVGLSSYRMQKTFTTNIV